MEAKPLHKYSGNPQPRLWISWQKKWPKWSLAVKTISWVRKHRSLVLVLHKDDYRTETREVLATINRIPKPETMCEAITSSSTPSEILTRKNRKRPKRQNTNYSKRKRTPKSIGSLNTSKKSMWKSLTRNTLSSQKVPSSSCSYIYDQHSARWLL